MDRTDPPGTPTSTRAKQAGAIGLILSSSVVIAAVPNFAKLAYESGASIPLVLVGRAAVSVLLLGTTLLVLRRSFAASARVLRLCAFGGVAAAVMSFGFLGSIASIDISLAILIFYLHVIVIAWIGQIRGTYKLTPARLAYCAVILVGLALALSVRVGDLALSGIALGLLGALGAAVMVVANGEAVAEAGSILVNFYSTLFALGVICVASVIAGVLVPPASSLGWIGIVGAGTAFCLGLALFFAAIPTIDVARASLIAIVEPLFAILLSMAMFGERLEFLQWIGVAIVLLGLALLELPPHAFARKSRRKLPIA
jgi:drug/metabolite transporter (DMT)-like permease